MRESVYALLQIAKAWGIQHSMGMVLDTRFRILLIMTTNYKMPQILLQNATEVYSAADMQKYCSSFPNRFIFGMMTP